MGKREMQTVTMQSRLAEGEPQQGSVLPVQKRKAVSLGRGRHSQLLVSSFLFHFSSRQCLTAGTSDHGNTVIAEKP